MIELVFGALFVFALLAWVRFGAALTLVVALLPTYLVRFSIATIPTNVLEALIGTLIVVGVARGYVRLRHVRTLPRALLVFSALFISAAIIAMVVSPNLETSLGILKSWVVVPILFSYTVYSALRNKQISRNAILESLILSGVVMALLGIAQIGTGERVSGIFPVPNSLALYLAPILAITIWKAGTACKSRKKRVMYGEAAAVMAIALLATQSLGGAGAVLGTTALGGIVWLKQKRRTLIVIGIASILIAAVFFATGKAQYVIRPLVTKSATSSASVRVQLWSISSELVSEHPVVGVGLGAFEPAYQQKLHERFSEYNEAPETHKKPIPEFVFRDPHNWVLSFWLNTGIVGLLAFIGLHVIGVRYASKKSTRSVNDQAVVLAIATLLLFGLVDTIYWKNDLSVLHWMLIALLLQYDTNQQYSDWLH